MHFEIKRGILAIASTFVILLIGLVLVSIFSPNISTSDDAREELLNFRNKLAIDMRKSQVEAIFTKFDYRYLKLAQVSERLWIIQTPYLAGAINWELRLSFINDSLQGYFVRTADSKKHLPKEAPADIGKL